MQGAAWRAKFALEADLRDAVEDYLRRRTDLVWSRTDAGSADRRTRGRNVRAGWADLTIVVRGGRAVLVELKREKGGKTRPKQAELRTAVLRLGGVAIEARSVAEVHAAVEGAMR